MYYIQILIIPAVVVGVVVAPILAYAIEHPRDVVFYTIGTLLVLVCCAWLAMGYTM